MRIALVDPSLFTVPYDEALTHALQALGHAVVVHGRRPSRDDNAVNGIPLETSFYRLTGWSPLGALPKPLRLGVKGVDHIVSMAGFGSRLKRWRPDIIHFQWLPLPVVDRRFLPRLRALAPLILTMHDSNPFNGNPAATLQLEGMGGSLTLFDRIIVHTERGRQRLREQGIADERLSVVPHGPLRLPERGISAIVPEPRILTFLLFGKLKPYKGADLLIEAFARLPPPLRSQAAVRIIGKPYMELAPLHALVERHGLAGQVLIEPRFIKDDEVGPLFRPGTIATFPYREIEASGVLSLAIAYGSPILATRIGGFAELIEDGVHGVLTPLEDADALSAAMARFITDRSFAARCAQNVRALAERLPRWAEIAERTVGIYEAARAQYH